MEGYIVFHSVVMFLMNTAEYPQIALKSTLARDSGTLSHALTFKIYSLFINLLIYFYLTFFLVATSSSFSLPEVKLLVFP